MRKIIGHRPTEASTAHNELPLLRIRAEADIMSGMRKKEPSNWLERILWPRERNRWEQLLASRLLAAKDRGVQVLVEPGCGRESRLISAAGMENAYKVGFDLDPVAAGNSDLSAFVFGDVCKAPLASSSADLILCRWVVEHLADPQAAAQECWRLLRPGGRMIVLVPNLLNPVIGGAKLTPTWLHVKLRRLSVGGELADNCPTYYRANMPGRLRAVFENAGFRTELVRCMDQAYSYFRFSRILMPFALLYGRLTDPRPLRWLKAAIVAEFVKPAE